MATGAGVELCMTLARVHLTNVSTAVELIGVRTAPCTDAHERHTIATQLPLDISSAAHETKGIAKGRLLTAVAALTGEVRS